MQQEILTFLTLNEPESGLEIHMKFMDLFTTIKNAILAKLRL